MKMKYLSYGKGNTLVIDGEKQKNRRARRSGETTARQQIKFAKSHRREIKYLMQKAA